MYCSFTLKVHCHLLSKIAWLRCKTKCYGLLSERNTAIHDKNVLVIINW